MDMHQIELSGIHHIQAVLRGPITDAFFIGWSYVDTPWFSILFLATITYLISRKEGISLLFLFIISGAVNTLLKQYFHLPRPCQIDPSVAILCLKSFGFPSGAAQTGTLIAGAALVKCRQLSWKIGGVIFALFLYFSRIYLGVHFFTDILGGIVVGASLVLIYYKLFPLLEKQWPRCALILSVIFFLIGGTRMLALSGMTLGIGIGLWLAGEKKLPSSRLRRLITLCVVLIGTYGLIYLGFVQEAIQIPALLLAGLWFSYLGSQTVNIKP
jgi:membrane-associated phospholipid phosphatase